ncbi:MAG: twin-arginine translocation signal domain-containing protein, partial [Mesorhizobium sp.]
MISIEKLSRRGFLNMGAAAGASLLLPRTGLIGAASA